MRTLTPEHVITRAGLAIVALMIARYETGPTSARAARHARKANER
jgi:hypothetical protein